MQNTNVSDKTVFGLGKQLAVACLWFAYSAQWGALLAVLLPRQIELIVGADQKYFFNGLIGPIGAFVALVVTPIAGALSDRSTHRWGRRRPYLLWGVLLNCAFLVFLGRFDAGSNVWLFALGVMGVQLGCNFWGGPYAGLIPDVVPEDRRSQASSLMALMTASGTIAGALIAGHFVASGFQVPYNWMAFFLLLFLVVTLVSVRETPRSAAPEAVTAREFCKSFWISPQEHPDFWWVLITRGLVMMGLYSVFAFFQYFFADILQVENAAESAGFLVGVVTAGGIPSALLGGWLADRIGRKKGVMWSGYVMVVASLLFVWVAFHPSVGATYACAALFGFGYGAYQAVDWALAIDVLPGGESAAKDMGIWHVSMVLPQMIGPFVTGAILSRFSGEGGSLLTGYTLAFVVTAAWFLLGTVFVKRIRGST